MEDIFLMLWFCWILMVGVMNVLMDLEYQECVPYDCNVIAFVSGLRCTLSKTAVQRNPLQIFKIPTFGFVMTRFS